MFRRTCRVFILVFGLLALGAGSLARAAERPNVVIILADDMGWGDPQCYWPKSKIPTPNVDRLAGEGMRFTDAHSPTAVCTPTRYALLTGRYCWRTRQKKCVLTPYAMPLIDRKRTTLAEMFQRHGYATAAFGKWHLGFEWRRNDGKKTPPAEKNIPDKVIDLSKPYLDGPCDHGFDTYFGVDVPNYPPYCFLEDDHVVSPLPNQFRPATNVSTPGRGQPDWQFDRILPTIKEKAVAWLRRHAAEKKDAPFFLYLPLTAPHIPIVPNEPFRGSTEATLYGDFVAEVDSLTGDVLNALEETGLAKNTIVVFTSDNGSPERNGKDGAGPFNSCITDSGHDPNGPWRGRKGDIHEAGHRVPLVVRWPGRVRPGSFSDELVCLVDWYATLAAVLGQPLADDVAEDSFNVLPVLLEKDRPGPMRKSLILHSDQGMFAIRVGPWKLIRGQGTGSFFTKDVIAPDAPSGQLYNLTDDPTEQKNLYRERHDVVERLSKMLDEQIQAGRTRPKQHP
ncbi:MAG: arylsulfatase [Pirellulales bacterium]|nr:arylsulfatase [Pirellulales bacterium]